jgi:hypothetical protein
MGIDDGLVGEYAVGITKFPGTQYDIESKEGQILDEMACNLARLNDENLSIEMRTQRDSLFTKITSEMLRGYDR